MFGYHVSIFYNSQMKLLLANLVLMDSEQLIFRLPAIAYHRGSQKCGAQMEFW